MDGITVIKQLLEQLRGSNAAEAAPGAAGSATSAPQRIASPEPPVASADMATSPTNSPGTTKEIDSGGVR